MCVINQMELNVLQYASVHHLVYMTSQTGGIMVSITQVFLGSIYITIYITFLVKPFSILRRGESS